MAAPRRKRAAQPAAKQPAAPGAKPKRGAKKTKRKAGLLASLAQYVKTKATGLVRRKPKAKAKAKRAKKRTS